MKDPITELGKAYEDFGHQMADAMKFSYEDGVKYGARTVQSQMNDMHDWASGGWHYCLGFWPHQKAANIAIAHAFYSVINWAMNFDADATTRYYETHDRL